MSAHLDLDGLADLVVGEGDGGQLDHVAHCARCSAALADLEQADPGVRQVLADLPEPDPPADLPARLDDAVRREPGPDPADADGRGGRRSSQPAEPVRTGTVVPLRRRRTVPRRLSGVAAAVAGLLVVSGLGVTASRLTGDSEDAATTATEGQAVAPEQAARAPTSSTGADYGAGRDALAAALPGLLAGGTDPAAAPTGDPLARLRDPAQLADCLSGLADPAAGSAPLALDYARYAGAPALVAVLPTTDPRQVEVFVVGPGCRPGAEDTLLFTRLARPS